MIEYYLCLWYTCVTCTQLHRQHVVYYVNTFEATLLCSRKGEVNSIRKNIHTVETGFLTTYFFEAENSKKKTVVRINDEN